ncbi:helix-turn-helix domain-containing protein [Polaromonas jejuensis]|uniref:RodZ domain-containing protein n=1 Tax=Polaromonas jejuensis TaxID=457502 RepID=A0ABW0QFM4_9BURK|nr:helix-turn-helix domain-containing protein [Polaromonas jejuensis]
MNELNPAVAGHFAAEAAGFGDNHGALEPTAGALLRGAREAAGLHIAALAASLKVPVKKLEALEQDRFELLPDAVFVRALASSVCRTLKVDPALVLQRLPQSSAPTLGGRGAGINAPFRSAADGPGPSLWAQVSRPAVLAGLAFLLGALVLIFLPAIKHDNGAPGKLGADKVRVDGEAAQALPATAVMDGPSQVNMPAASVPPAEEPVAAASASTAGPETSPVSTAATLPVAAAAPAAVPAPALANPTAAAPASPAAETATSGIVTFHAKGQSWIEVTDAKGAVVLRRTLAAGEVAGASGAMPLAAVVGNADATLVQVRGKAFDLAGLARNNVARFEVK